MTFIRIFQATLGALVMLAAHAQGSETAAGTDSAQIKRGEYIAHLGDCVACHTAPGGKLMAGGLELKTPMGIIYSSNITPDPETGIGKYTFEEFARAMREGVNAQGQNLYPAMPYPSYAKMTDDDLKDLFAYLLGGVPAVNEPNIDADMSFPFNLRWGLMFWNMVFVDSEPFTPDPN
ncbi:MAG TPA: cytochrome C, partial [Pseudomonas sp.]|nr:cytochrome C [Pseudomonas sp.]